MSGIMRARARVCVFAHLTLHHLNRNTDSAKHVNHLVAQSTEQWQSSDNASVAANRKVANRELLVDQSAHLRSTDNIINSHFQFTTAAKWC